MERISCKPRENYKQIIENFGFTFHENYWLEDCYYRFSEHEIDYLEEASNDLNAMCLKAVQYIVDNNLFKKIGIKPEYINLVKKSWQNHEKSLYGRFDFGYANNEIKLYEYNADTPTSLLEASVIQWQWLEDQFPDKDQFNSIHEKLIESWKHLDLNFPIVHLTCFIDNEEDYQTTKYLADLAEQAGFQSKILDIRDIGLYNEKFLDTECNQIHNLFKLYPWEDMVNDEFGKHIENSSVGFIEPAWKLILSNKAILAILWKLFPNHPYLLETYFEDDIPLNISGNFVKKPFFSREGANIAIGNIFNGKFNKISETNGKYFGPYIVQRQFDSKIDNKNFVIGSWIVDSQSAGIGIREDSGVTQNTSHFIPHIFD